MTCGYNSKKPVVGMGLPRFPHFTFFNEKLVLSKKMFVLPNLLSILISKSVKKMNQRLKLFRLSITEVPFVKGMIKRVTNTCKTVTKGMLVKV